MVDACGGRTPETIPDIPKAVKHLGTLLEGSSKRLLVVGGAGSLYVNSEYTLTLADGDSFPEAFKPWLRRTKACLTTFGRGESVISYADYALAMVDEIEQGRHLRERISVVRK